MDADLSVRVAAVRYLSDKGLKGEVIFMALLLPDKELAEMLRKWKRDDKKKNYLIRKKKKQ